jgi:hypothetical protein
MSSGDPLDALEVGPVEHRRGCPAATHELGEEGSRIERFTLPGSDGRTWQVTRCIECGQQVEEVVEGG